MTDQRSTKDNDDDDGFDHGGATGSERPALRRFTDVRQAGYPVPPGAGARHREEARIRVEEILELRWQKYSLNRIAVALELKASAIKWVLRERLRLEAEKHRSRIVAVARGDGSPAEVAEALKLSVADVREIGGEGLFDARLALAAAAPPIEVPARRANLHGASDGLLRLYRSDECGPDGYPRGWLTCKQCGGRGSRITIAGEHPCERCGGFGSLRNRARDLLTQASREWFEFHQLEGDFADWPAETQQSIRALWSGRCEDCGHPAADGRRRATKEWPTDSAAEAQISSGREPHLLADAYTACDAECTHPAEEARLTGPWSPTGDHFQDVRTSGAQAGAMCAAGLDTRASWREALVRQLSGQRDVRPEHLALLCTRCRAERHMAVRELSGSLADPATVPAEALATALHGRTVIDATYDEQGNSDVWLRLDNGLVIHVELGGDSLGRNRR